MDLVAAEISGQVCKVTSIYINAVRNNFINTLLCNRYDSSDNTSTVLVKSPSFAEPNSNPFPCGEKGVEKKLLPCPAGMH